MKFGILNKVFQLIFYKTGMSKVGLWGQLWPVVNSPQLLS